MAQLPTVPDEWYPLAPSAFLAAPSSTALSIPPVPAGQPAKGTVHVGILTAIGGTMWIRYDGNAAFSVIGAEPMFEGDFVVVYGYQALKAIRIINDPAALGLMGVKYFYFRKTP